MFHVEPQRPQFVLSAAFRRHDVGSAQGVLRPESRTTERIRAALPFASMTSACPAVRPMRAQPWLISSPDWHALVPAGFSRVHAGVVPIPPLRCAGREWDRDCPPKGARDIGARPPPAYRWREQWAPGARESLAVTRGGADGHGMFHVERIARQRESTGRHDVRCECATRERLPRVGSAATGGAP
jgi:hypothetical protein